ncbi:hypothetical protein C6W27_08965 [Bacillus paralicheniformis]|uniref:hypothetical protein n=1 Tax=Bacillus paralicheniformis TaxID=1648923 RepID=UPI000D02DB34|nr:hypothetical protein [Bacillus paralicheniformis]PRS16521.1 hypothetical protein C6W27_08965 [Bacillus paralicheniformis]
MNETFEVIAIQFAESKYLLELFEETGMPEDISYYTGKVEAITETASRAKTKIETIAEEIARARYYINHFEKYGSIEDVEYFEGRRDSFHEAALLLGFDKKEVLQAVDAFESLLYYKNEEGAAIL